MEDSLIFNQLSKCLTETNFTEFGEKYAGKVRDCYSYDQNKLILVTSDRLSCFDRIVTSVPFKGQILNSMALFWFDKIKNIIPTHVISSPHPNVIIGQAAKTLPVEVVVRGYLTGSAWRDYEKGLSISGVTLPKGMKKNQKLSEPIITPSTKAPKGEHDLPISEKEIVSSGIVESTLWNKVRTKALEIFNLGSKVAESNGLILVDTKYEFGMVNNELILVDEVHTLDSSRYWIGKDYIQKFEAGVEPTMLDKEPTRQWLISKGFMGEGQIPEFTDSHRVDIAKHYINSYKLITGTDFISSADSTSDSIRNACLSAL
jgi:phosphoribosylaminoimidazole-succinocarboxamide synthase